MQNYKKNNSIVSKNEINNQHNSYLNHSFELSEEQIKKSAKKLQKSLLAIPELDELTDKEKTFSLMKCQNIISQSLGFDSFYAVQQYNKQYNIEQLKNDGILFEKNNTSNDFRIGTMLENNKPVYLTNDALKKHSFFIGEKESDFKKIKSNLFEHAIKNKIPLICFENKGDSSIHQHIFKLAREHQREDDILVLNYMTGNSDLFEKNKQKISNTLNIFEKLSSGAIIELLINLIPGDNLDKGYLLSYLSPLIMTLVYLRDNERLLLNISTILEHIGTEKLLTLYKNKSLPQHINKAIESYFTIIFNNNKLEQSDTQKHIKKLQEQLTLLNNSYSHIFNTNLSEIDYEDVIKNKRILIILCPALEACSEDLILLCNIQVSILKTLTTYQLGTQIENRREEQSQGWIFLNSGIDYMSNGISVLPAQLRSLNMSLFVFETKYPQTQIGKSFYYQLNHHFYFKGYHPNLEQKFQKITPQLKDYHCIYQYKEHNIFLNT